MMRALARDTLIYGGAAIVSRGLSLILLPIYTRILSPGDYGVLDMVMVLGTFAILLVALEITQALARFYGETQDAAAKRRMASTTLWFTVTAFAIVFAAAFAAAAPLAGWLLGTPAMAGPLRIGLAGIAVNGIFYLAQNQLRFELRSGAYAAISLVYAFALAGFSITLGYGFGLGLVGVLWGQLAGAVAAAALGLYLLRESYGLEFDRTLLRSMLAFSLPLVPSGLATFITLYANRLLLNRLEGLDSVGIFGVGVRVAGAIALLILGLQSALTPLIYAHYREPETPRQLARLTEQFIALALTCCLGLGILSWEILALFAERRYMGAAPLVLLLAPATLLGQMSIFFPGIAIAKRTKLQLYIFLATAVATVGLNWLLIESTGLMGAAAATLLASLLFIALWAWTSQRLYPIPVSWGRIGAGCALFVVAAAAGLWLQSTGLPLLPLILAKGILVLLFLAGTAACGLLRPADLVQLGRRMTGRAAA
jgi:O-antigen/teichoic acid export membrane protein